MFPSPRQFHISTLIGLNSVAKQPPQTKLSAMIFPKVRVSSSSFYLIDVAWAWDCFSGLRFGPIRGEVCFKSLVYFGGPILFHVPWDGSKGVFGPWKGMCVLSYTCMTGVSTRWLSQIWSVNGTWCAWSGEKITGWSMDGVVSFCGEVD